MSVLAALAGVKGLKATLKKQGNVIDNVIFRFSSSFTAIIMVTCSVLLTMNWFIAAPIQCINSNDIPANIINNYCWIMTTFTMPDAHNRKIGLEVPHPGLSNPHEAGEDEDPKYATYYQWVVFVLCFQAVLSYFPKYLWKAMEGKRMSTLSMGLNVGMMKESDSESKRKQIVSYMLEHLRFHNTYAYQYFFCEVLSLVIVLLQMFLINDFFGGEFLRYGSRVLEFSEMDQEDRVDPMIYIFPRITKCTFHKFGPSGTITRHDSLCVLALNVINEKSYIFLWFWFIVIACLLGLVVIFRLATIILPTTRPAVLHFSHREITVDTCEAISRKTTFGDWFLLYMLGFNMDPIHYRSLMADLAKEIDTAASNNSQRSENDYVPS